MRRSRLRQEQVSQRSSIISAKLSRPFIESGRIHPVRQFQRALGNRAMQQMLQAQEGASGPKVFVSARPGCSPCLSRNPVAPPGRQKTRLQAKGILTNDLGKDTIAPPIVQEVLQSSGRPLDPATREFMEPRFNRDFGQVRLHVGSRAAESARAVQAQAYAVGRDIVMGAESFALHTDAGKRLLVHELVHVVQQSASSERKNRHMGEAAPVQERSTGLRLARQNTQQTGTVLGRGLVAGVQFVGGTMTATRVGPVSQQTDISVIVDRLTTIRELARLLLPLWNTATPFTPPGAAAPNPLVPLTVDDLAKGLLVQNRYRLAIPPAANPAVMTYWRIGMRFRLPIRIDTTTNEGILHPDVIRSMSGTFDPTWSHLLDERPKVLAGQTVVDQQQAVAVFLANQPTLSARGSHLGGRAVTNAQESQEFILEAFNQVGAGAFDLALEFMAWLVNKDISVLAPQTAGAAILARIRTLLAAPPANLTADQQSRLTRANLMLGLVAAVLPQPYACVPNRQLTWDDFTGAVPGGAHEALTHFTITQVAFQGNQLLHVTQDPGASWVRPGSKQPGNIAVNGAQQQITACETYFNNVPAGNAGATWGFSGAPSATCPASIVAAAVTANNFGQCATVIGPAWIQSRQADSPRLLRHEQLHFDIPCVLAHKANAVRAGGTAVSLAAVITRANQLTVQYDNQTNHGCIAANQAQWENDVAAGLPNQTFP